MKITAPRDWDAETYQRVSGPQVAWGSEVLDRLELRGDETVLDAGCGTGRVTALIRERVPRGRVIGVDASPSMIEAARANLPGDVELRVADLLELELPEPVDLVFSTATFHWLLDHDRLFARLHAVLVPGGRLHAQCGGQGNIAGFTAAMEQVARLHPYATHLTGKPYPVNFASPAATQAALTRAGFTQVECGLEPKPVIPPEPRAFVATVCLGAVLDSLPAELRDGYIDEVLARMPDPPTLDYVRLNISAIVPR